MVQIMDPGQAVCGSAVASEPLTGEQDRPKATDPEEETSPQSVQDGTDPA
jgi:hypothetical protein